MIHIIINGRPVEAAGDSTIVEAAKSVGIKVPSLYHMKNTHQYDSCRTCVVEVEGMRNLQASCMAKVWEGVIIRTHSLKMLEVRKVLYELLLSNHPKDCLDCGRSTNCEPQDLGYELGVTKSHFEGAITKPLVGISPSITRDTNKCILCRRCVTVCRETQKVGAIQAQNRGFDTVVSPVMGLPLDPTAYAMCSQYTVVCPMGALRGMDGLTLAWRALADPGRRVVARVAPAVRAALGEKFDLPVGTPVTDEMATALHEIGFDDVFDTLFSADLITLEEGAELLGRFNAVLKGGDNKEGPTALPMITSYSPGQVKHIKHQLPGELDHLSTCKSLHTMLGAVVKSSYTERTGTDPKDMFVISVMPCTAKKYEIRRPEMEVDKRRDVDAVLTTKELTRVIEKARLDFVDLPEGEFNSPLGLGIGAADIFGVTDGVMETALRAMYEVVASRGLPFEKLHVTPIVGLDQIKAASITIERPLSVYGHLNGVMINVAVTNGLEEASKLMKEMAAGTSPYHFIEVMGCPGGCINGGGQSCCTEENYREERLKTPYSEDERKVLRKSYENPGPMKFHNKYLGEPNGHLSHHLLHTHYVKRGRYNQLVK